MRLGEWLQHGWWPWMAQISLQLGVLFAVVAILDRLLRRRVGSGLPLALWLLVPLKLVLPPTLASPVSLVSITGPLATPVAPSPAANPTGLVVATFLVWILGALLLAFVAFGRWRATRIRWSVENTTAAPAPVVLCARRAAERLGLRRLPPIRLAEGAGGPFVLGVLSPRVVLPTRLASTATPQRLEHVFLHELTHIKRLDGPIALACLVLQVVYWFHPAVWIARRRLETLRELCCDEAVARTLGDEAPLYRRTLLDLARPMISGEVVGACHFIHPSSLILERIERLERGPRVRPGRQRFASVVLCTLLAACCVPLADRVPVPAAATSPPFENALGDVAPEDLPGCLQLRYYVLQEMAKQPASVPD